MKLVAILHAARARLGAGPNDDAATLRRAYRRAVRQHPPDRDPEEFQRVRAAYELLQDPVAAIQQRLMRPLPLTDPPRPPESQPSAPRGATALGILRLAAGSLPASQLLPAELLQPVESGGVTSLDRSSDDQASAAAGVEPHDGSGTPQATAGKPGRGRGSSGQASKEKP